MTRKFDRLQSYGTVTPPYNGAVFYQDGGYFSASGDLVFEDHPPTPGEVVKSEVTTVDSATGTLTTEVVETVQEHVDPGDPKVVLKDWLTGAAPLNHMKARSLVKVAYSRTLTTKDEIIDFLVNEANLVPAEAVKVS